MRIAIVGAGISGLACAQELARSGHDVAVLDKGRAVGGRMSTRRMPTAAGEAAFDHGAQYFTVRDPAFASLAREWQAAGAAEPWPLAGDEAWVGVPGMNAVIKHMAAGLDVQCGVRIIGMERKSERWTLRHEHGEAGPFDAVILAIPAEQAASLLSLVDFPMACIALRSRSQPCWTGMFAFAERLALGDAPLRNRGAIAWAVRGSAKPGRQGPESWVVQATPEWSQEHLEDAAPDIARSLLLQLAAHGACAVPEPIASTAHRWRFAMSSATGDGALWNPQLGIGACGDWLLGPRVECAWLSGVELANTICLERDADLGGVSSARRLNR